ncbi:MAG TPA: hypothetical protein VF065_01040 [Ilumatobacter sp.]
MPPSSSPQACRSDPAAVVSDSRTRATTRNVYAQFLEAGDREAADAIGGLLQATAPEASAELTDT